MTYTKDYIIEENKKYRAEILPELSEHCLLCRDAPCTAACPEGLDPARMIRAVRFDNAAGAYGFAGGGCAAALPCVRTRAWLLTDRSEYPRYRRS